MAGTVVAATLERWWFPRAWAETALPASRLYFGDTPAYLQYAAALSAGDPFDNGIPFHPPGWPLFLSVIFRLCGWSAAAPPDPLLLKHLSAVLSGATVGLASLLGYKVGGRPAMVFTSFLGVFHFGHLVQSATPNAEPLYGLLIVAVMLGAVYRLGAWPLGILAGAATLVRAEFALGAALICLWIASNAGQENARRQAIRFGVAFTLILIPTTVVNWMNITSFNQTRQGRMPGPLPRFAPVTSYGPFNFANANHEGANGGFNWALPALASDAGALSDLEQAELDLSRPAVYEVYVNGYRIGMKWIAGHPTEAARLIARKLAITASVFDYGYLLDNVPIALRGLRRPVDQIDVPASWLTALHATLTVAGIWIAARAPDARVLLAPVATLAASSVLFFGYVRLGVAYLPILWVLQALTVSRLAALSRAASGLSSRTEVAAAALIVLLLVTEWSRVDHPRRLMIDGLVDENGRIVEDQAMTLERVR